MAAAPATAAPAAPAAAPAAATAEPAPPAKPAGRPLQLVSIDLESDRVVVREDALQEIQKALDAAGGGKEVQKLAIVGVIGAFRTGKSFLLDLMLRYLRFSEEDRKALEAEDCEVPEWVLKNGVPDWAVQCGDSLIEGREGIGAEEREGFVWRPGMEKCTEGIWVWSEVFVREVDGERVALLLMDTQGAWDAQMTKEQSATVFGLTTLLTSRLVYNVAKQIQQDKIDNLLYFTDFALAALRTQERAALKDGRKPFQTLEFLVRDWPHYPEDTNSQSGRAMMTNHLKQFQENQTTDDSTSMDALGNLFSDIDVWCLPHPSLKVERKSWNGDLKVVEPIFWRLLDGYMQKVFGNLNVKTALGTPITVKTFSQVVTDFAGAFRDAAPQAKTFAEAMQSSTSLLARDSAIRVLKEDIKEKVLSREEALAPEAFEEIAEDAAKRAREEFGSKALFGTAEAIKEVEEQLEAEVSEELSRSREENERRLEAQLSGLTNASLAAVGAFGLDRVSDFTCDWWSGLCRDLSGDLMLGYTGIALFVAFRIFSISEKEGQLSATVASIELAKAMAKRVKTLSAEAESSSGPSEKK